MTSEPCYVNDHDNLKVRKTKTKKGIDIIYSDKNHLSDISYDSLYDELPYKDNSFNILDFEGINEAEICDYTRGALQHLSPKDNILLGYPYEAIHSTYWNIILNIVQTFGYKKILWIDGGMDDSGILYWSHLRDVKIKHLPSPAFFKILFRPGVTDTIPSPGDIQSKSKHFLSLSRLVRQERIYFSKKLLENPDIFDKGIISCGWGKETLHLWKDEAEQRFLKKMLTDEELLKFPITLNHDDNLQHHLLDEFKSALFNVVQESSVGNDFRSHMLYYNNVLPLRYINYSDRVFITEKSIKPFLLNQLPLVLASPGMVQILRKRLNFDMFDDIINHDYDKEDNLFKRCDMIFEELKRLVTERTVPEWIEYLQSKNISERFTYNFNNVLRLRSSSTIINWVNENF